MFPNKIGYQKLLIYPIIKDAIDQYTIICNRSDSRLFYWNTSLSERNCTLLVVGLYIKIRQ